MRRVDASAGPMQGVGGGMRKAGLCRRQATGLRLLSLVDGSVVLLVCVLLCVSGSVWYARRQSGGRWKDDAR